jgi:hypothetical protein
MTTILVLGGNFGGMTSAFELRRCARTRGCRRVETKGIRVYPVADLGAVR